MNLADAIRQASLTTVPAPPEEAAAKPLETPVLQVESGPASPPTVETTSEAPEVQTAPEVHAAHEEQHESFEEMEIPKPPHESVMHGGNFVRMEMFLSPEQMSGLLRAVVGTQHSVMTTRETASYLRLSTATVEAMAQAGELPAFQLDGKWRFPKQGIDEWITLQACRKETA
ncbi:MAG TPA: helix-turn-helix domain-containing protein [Fimbriimonadaceae bacterium]|nr:helix-turn-helix domain-containing protein [Fimbriimonadaceae bacterium]